MRVDTTRSAIQRALWQERTLVRTYGIRGTIHLFPSGELPLWMAAIRAREAAATKPDNWYGQHGEQIEVLVQAIRDSLDGRVLSQRELGAEVVKRAGAWAGEVFGDAWVSGWPRWRIALGPAARRGALCFAEPRGNEVTFARPDEWLDGWEHVDSATALATVLRRFLHAYGPSRPREFAEWFNLPLAAAKNVFSSLEPELVEVQVDDERGTRYALRDFGGSVSAGAGSVRLLPHFDCYLRGCYPRERLALGDHRQRSGGGTGQFPVLLVDGTVAGVWERRGAGKRLEVTVDSFVRLNASQRRAVARETERIGRILEAPANLVFGPVEVRAHL